MRYLPLVMTLALLLNFSTVLFFKFKVARDLNVKISELSSASDRRFEAFASDVLHRVDGFLYSNVVARSSSSVSPLPSSPAALSPADERRLVLHEVVSSDFDYDYFFDGNLRLPVLFQLTDCIAQPSVRVLGDEDVGKLPQVELL